MLVEVKVKVSRIIDTKERKRTETYIINKDFFSEAEYKITEILTKEQKLGVVNEFEIQALKISSIKEIYSATKGNYPFIVTLKDLFVDDKGKEKYSKYKVLLWADDLVKANQKAQSFAMQGYEMLIEGIKQVELIYLEEINNA